MSPEGLAVDVARRRMFWVDSTPDKIESAKLDGSDRRVLFNTDLVNPRAIIVDSLSGWALITPFSIHFLHTSAAFSSVSVRHDVFQCHFKFKKNSIDTIQHYISNDIAMLRWNEREYSSGAKGTMCEEEDQRMRTEPHPLRPCVG